MRPATADARHAPRRFALALAGGWIAISAIVLAPVLVQLRDQAFAAGERLVRSFAQIAEEQTTGTLDAAAELLRSTGRLLPAPGSQSVSVATDAARALFHSIQVLDSDGRPLPEAGPGSEPEPSHAAGEVLRALRAQPEQALQVGVPTRSAADGTWLIPVGVPWRGPAGAVAGAVVGFLPVTRFERAWSVEGAGGGRSITLFRADAILLMRSPFAEHVVGKRLDGVALFREHLPARASGTLLERSPIDGQMRLLGYRRLGAYPGLLVVATETADQVTAAWWQTVYLALAGWLASTVLLGTLALWLGREWRRRLEGEARLAAANAVLHGEIVERSRAEQEANAARTRLLDAVTAFPGSFRLFDADERLILSNGVQWLSDPGMAVDKWIGVSFPEIAARAGELELAAAAAGRGEEWTLERVAQFRRGHTDAEVQWGDGRWFHLLERPTSEGGRVSIRLDITAQKRFEEQLRQAQKMDAIGRLTGGIAHDFNNMLTVIIGNAELIAERRDLPPEVRTAVDLVLRAGDAAAELTSRLLAFARRTPLQPQRVQVNGFIARIELLLRRTLGAQFDIRLALPDDSWDVLIDPSQLETALLNLVLNARDAMPGGGHLTIETANVVLDAAQVAADGDARPGEFVAVTISDTGVGMAAETMQRAFEPFFTTKEVGKGTGLGLSMVYGFVRQSGGQVKIYSEPGRGTTVRMYLPRAADGAPATELAEDGPIPIGAGERILVAEDDDLVRGHVIRQLEALGYQVVAAENGPAALALLDRPGAIDLLLTDMVMPGGMTGRDLAEAVLRTRPGLPVLFMSGYTETAVVHGGQLDPDARLLGKPYRLRDLATKVRAALDGR